MRFDANLQAFSQQQMHSPKKNATSANHEQYWIKIQTYFSHNNTISNFKNNPNDSQFAV